MSIGSDRLGEKHHTDASPDYPLFSRATGVSIGVAAGLTAFTLGLLWVARGTMLAETTVWLYTEAPLAPYAGIVVFGIALTGGRLVGLRAAVDERYMVSDDARSPVANGIGVYVAFMGVFVHILRLVLEAMAEGE